MQVIRKADNMKGSEAKLLGFMEGANNRYIIPVYQRKYDWKIENCNKLYEDLKKIIRNKRGSHFFGSVVSQVVPNGSKIEFHIIDGQQRLTSMYQAVYDNKPVRTVTEKKVKISRFYYLDMKKCLDENEDRVEAVLSIPEDRKLKENFDLEDRVGIRKKFGFNNGDTIISFVGNSFGQYVTGSGYSIFDCLYFLLLINEISSILSYGLFRILCPDDVCQGLQSFLLSNCCSCSSLLLIGTIKVFYNYKRCCIQYLLF